MPGITRTMVPFGAALIAAWIDSPSFTTTTFVGAGPATDLIAPAAVAAPAASPSALNPPL